MKKEGRAGTPNARAKLLWVEIVCYEVHSCSHVQLVKDGGGHVAILAPANCQIFEPTLCSSLSSHNTCYYCEICQDAAASSSKPYVLRTPAAARCQPLLVICCSRILAFDFVPVPAHFHS